MLRKKEKKQNRINGNTYRDRVELRPLSANQLSLRAQPSLLVILRSLSLSLSIQRNMYNYKGYKKGSDINRQKYTELLFTCLLNVRKSSYTHTSKKKEKRMPSDL